VPHGVRTVSSGFEASERPVIRLARVFQIARVVSDRYRHLALWAAFGPMRWGEVDALHWSEPDPAARETVIPRLSTQGYRCWPPTSGSSLPAPGHTADATTACPELVEDVGALIDASGAEKVHLVGHNWVTLVGVGVRGKPPGPSR
jgi:hypothetical protein